MSTKVIITTEGIVDFHEFPPMALDEIARRLCNETNVAAFETAVAAKLLRTDEGEPLRSLLREIQQAAFRHGAINAVILFSDEKEV